MVHGGMTSFNCGRMGLCPRWRRGERGGEGREDTRAVGGRMWRKKGDEGGEGGEERN